MLSSVVIRLKRLPRHKDGAAALEFAMVAAPLIAIILASLQTAVVVFEDQALQTVAEQSARQLMTGKAQLASMTQTQFKNVVCGFATTFTCSKLMVDVQSGSQFSSINTTTLTPTYNGSGTVTNTWSYSPGNPGDIVIMRVMYNWPVVGGPLGFKLANQPNNNYLLVATAVFKNEPY
jgi:Flp pilus assembly protein TadG